MLAVITRDGIICREIMRFTERLALISRDFTVNGLVFCVTYFPQTPCREWALVWRDNRHTNDEDKYFSLDTYDSGVWRRVVTCYSIFICLWAFLTTTLKETNTADLFLDIQCFISSSKCRREMGL